MNDIIFLFNISTKQYISYKYIYIRKIIVYHTTIPYLTGIS